MASSMDASSSSSSSSSNNMMADHSSSSSSNTEAGGWVVVSGPQFRSNNSAKSNSRISLTRKPVKQKLVYVVSGTFVAGMILAASLFLFHSGNKYARSCTMIGCWDTLYMTQIPLTQESDQARSDKFVYKVCIDEGICTNEVTIDGNWRSVDGSPFTYSVSGDSNMVSINLPPPSSQPFVGKDYYAKRTKQIHLMVVRSSDGHVVVNAKTKASFTCSRPNGPKCDPLCCSTTWKIAPVDYNGGGKVAVKRNLFQDYEKDELTDAITRGFIEEDEATVDELLDRLLQEMED